MAKSVAEKLLIRPDATVWLSDDSRRGLIEPMPAGANLVDDPAQASVAVLFVDSAASVREELDVHHQVFGGLDAFWVAYPKGGRAEINRDSLWPIVAEYGMRPITQVALDEVWSALRFRPLREGEAPMPGR